MDGGWFESGPLCPDSGPQFPPPRATRLWGEPLSTRRSRLSVHHHGQGCCPCRYCPWRICPVFPLGL